MATGTVNGLTYHLVDANAPAERKERVEVFVVPGLNGIGAQLLAENESECAFDLTFFGTDAACITRKLVIARLQGEVIDVTDSQGHTYSDVLISKISNTMIATAVHAIGLGILGKSCKATIRGVFT